MSQLWLSCASNYLRTEHRQARGNTGAEELWKGVRKEGMSPCSFALSINRGFISVRFSLLHATASAASVKRPSKILLKVSWSSVRIFFHAVQTKRRYCSFSSFPSHLCDRLRWGKKQHYCLYPKKRELDNLNISCYFKAGLCSAIQVKSGKKNLQKGKGQTIQKEEPGGEREYAEAGGYRHWGRRW